MELRRIAALAAAGFTLATFAWPADRPPPARPSLVAMQAEPVPALRGDSEQRRVGGLIFLGGWRLSSRDIRFGGISAMHVEKGEVLALSDSGSRFRFRVPAGAGPLPLRIDGIPSGPGTGRWKSDRDGEALAVAGDRVWVAFEGRNAIWRYRLPHWRFEAAAAPAAIAELPFARGPEAMVRLADGRFLLFAEGPQRDDGTTPLVLFDGDPTLAATATRELRYRPPQGYRATDAALLPDGRVLVLNRTFSIFSWWDALLTVVDQRSLRGERTLEGREIADLNLAPAIDNMEALSVTRERGRTIVWIASDDNFNPLIQRTLLLKFALAD